MSTRLTRYIAADRATVYRALLDADAIAAWRAPNGMTAVVHTLDARVGGQFRVSLTYDSPARQGKSTAHTDTYHGRFIELVPEERVIEEIEFEASDPALRGVMRITTTLGLAAPTAAPTWSCCTRGSRRQSPRMTTS